MPTLGQLLVFVSFVPPFWLAFWWVERRGALASDREKLLTFVAALVAALILTALALLTVGT